MARSWNCEDINTYQEEFGNTLCEFRQDVSLERIFHRINIMLKVVLEKDSSGDTLLVEIERGNPIKDLCIIA